MFNEDILNPQDIIIERNYSRNERISIFKHILNDYHNKLASNLVTLEEHSHDLEKIVSLGNRINEETGLDPVDLLFWHMLIGSTPAEDITKMTLDTPNNDIERFIQLL